MSTAVRLLVVLLTVGVTEGSRTYFKIRGFSLHFPLSCATTDSNRVFAHSRCAAACADSLCNKILHKCFLCFPTVFDFTVCLQGLCCKMAHGAPGACAQTLARAARKPGDLLFVSFCAMFAFHAEALCGRTCLTLPKWPCLGNATQPCNTQNCTGLLFVWFNRYFFIRLLTSCL